MKRITLIIILFLMIIAGVEGGPGNGDSDILVKLNFYRGLKDGIPKGESVISAYFLKPLFVGNVMFESGSGKEAEEIKKIFNLSGIRLMSEAQWGWRSGEKKKEFDILILNGHEFLVEVMMKDIPDNFIVAVSNRSDGAVLMRSDLILPEKKSSVFGFEDPAGKPFFLSLSRAAGESIIRKEDEIEKISAVKNPVLRKRVKPVFPKEAVEKRLSGIVKIEAVSDSEGKVIEANVIRGAHPLLNKAAVDALKQWEYDPFIINGKPSPVRFTVVIKFQLSEDGAPEGKGPEAKTPGKKGSAGGSENVPGIWPAKGYLTAPFGDMINPVTKKKVFHNGIDIAAKKGTKVIAPAGGMVTEAKFYKLYGKMIVIDHGNGYVTRYAHLDAFKVKKGDQVNRNDLIGLVGSTGQSTAPHLHWEVHFEGKPVDPLKLIKE